MFGSTPCNSFILNSIMLKFLTVIGMNQRYSHTKIIGIFLEKRHNDIISHFLLLFVSCPTSSPIWKTRFCLSALQRMYCNRKMKCSILLKFGIEVIHNVSKNHSKFYED